MTGDPVECAVEIKAAVHFQDCPTEDIHITAGIVAAQLAFGQVEAGFDVVERMPRASGPAKEHF